jgi:hypothetical protein
MKRVGCSLIAVVILATGCGNNQAVIPTQMVLPSATVMVRSTDTPQPSETPAPTDTPAPTATASAEPTLELRGDRATLAVGYALGELISNVVSDLEGVVAIQSVSFSGSVSVEMVVSDGFNTLEMAQRAMATARILDDDFYEIFVLIQGDDRLTSYAFQEGEWRSDEVTPIDAPLVEPDGT